MCRVSNQYENEESNTKFLLRLSYICGFHQCLQGILTNGLCDSYKTYKYIPFMPNTLHYFGIFP
jgi:hypothetical protein